jgi:hypothetical protein
VNLNTLVAAIQNAVQAQNLIATNLKNVNTTMTGIESVVSTLNNTLSAAFPTPVLSAQAWTPGGIATGASAAISFTVGGVLLGEFVKASINADLQGCSLTGYVQSNNTVEAVINNSTGATVTFAAVSLKVSVASS